MRRTALLSLLCLLACGDPGLRDRSLVKLEDGHGNPLYTLRHKKKGLARTSVIGLKPDPLAQYYPEDVEMVVRFNDLSTLGRDVAPQLRIIEGILPQLGLPSGKPVDLLRQALDLPQIVAIDPVRPFAFVKTKEGWAGIVPTRSRDQGGLRLKQIDAVYCVAGAPEMVAAFRPGFRKGFFLPGDCSLIVTPVAYGTLGETMSEVARQIGVDLSVIDRWLPELPPDIERVDLALRLRQGGLRIDVRAAPNRDSPTAVFLERMRPSSSAAARWLPSQGTVYCEFVSRPADWERFLSVFLRHALPPMDGELAQMRFSLGRFLNALGRDASAVLTLDESGVGSVVLVAHLDDPAATQAFFGSYDLIKLLQGLAGPDGRLDWAPKVFERNGVRVNAIRGQISRKRLLAWRRSGEVFPAVLGVLMRGPVTCYVAVVDDKLCLVIGPSARTDAERYIDHLQKGSPLDNDHNVEVVSLFPQRLAAVSVDLAGLFNGTRAAAPFWHPNGRVLRDMTLRWRLPASVAVTSEGGALRIAVRVRPAMIAEAAARISARLEQE
ncbi:MAG: hypothetical protein ACYTEZ_02045 [Planctomycetota bacterium]|jgi:hypothetical protein